MITYPDGHEQTILERPEVRFQLADQLRAGRAAAHSRRQQDRGHRGVYDNSLKNKWNPGPQLEVFWSEQSWDEMYQPFTEYSVDSQDLTKIVPVNP